jgi:hypothetical protein
VKRFIVSRILHKKDEPFETRLFYVKAVWFLLIYGRSIPKSSQIFLARNSLISLWRGIDVILPLSGFL